jgi:hypothetical protein
MHSTRYKLSLIHIAPYQQHACRTSIQSPTKITCLPGTLSGVNPLLPLPLPFPPLPAAPAATAGEPPTNAMVGLGGTGAEV